MLVHRITIEMSDETDTSAPSGIECNELDVMYEACCHDPGGYIAIKANRWAVDDGRDMGAFLQLIQDECDALCTKLGAENAFPPRG